MNALKQRLFDEYGYLQNKRIKDLNKMDKFIVDDRGEKTNRETHDAEKKVFLWFCTITVSVLSETVIQVNLGGTVPHSEQLDTWVKSFQESEDFDISSYPYFRLKKGQEDVLNQLADNIEAIVAPNAPRYNVNSYKHSCPRTAASLRRLAELLGKFWKDVE